MAGEAAVLLLKTAGAARYLAAVRREGRKRAAAPGAAEAVLLEAARFGAAAAVRHAVVVVVAAPRAVARHARAAAVEEFCLVLAEHAAAETAAVPGLVAVMCGVAFALPGDAAAEMPSGVAAQSALVEPPVEARVPERLDLQRAAAAWLAPAVQDDSSGVAAQPDCSQGRAE